MKRSHTHNSVSSIGEIKCELQFSLSFWFFRNLLWFIITNLSLLICSPTRVRKDQNHSKNQNETSFLAAKFQPNFIWKLSRKFRILAVPAIEDRVTAVTINISTAQRIRIALEIYLKEWNRRWRIETSKSCTRLSTKLWNWKANNCWVKFTRWESQKCFVNNP